MSFFNQFVDKGLLERLHHVMTSDFGHVTYTEAIALLEPHNDQFEYPVHWGSDLQTEHERYLTEVVFQRPVFVTDYPKEIKAFYMKLNPDGKTVAAMDCLVPGIGEIIGGSQREDDLETLRNRMHELGLKEEDYGFYLDLRKYGSLPFGTRRFNRISAQTRTGLGYCSILPVRVFLSRLPFVHDRSSPCASRLSGNCLPPLPATLVSPIA